MRHLEIYIFYRMCYPAFTGYPDIGFWIWCLPRNSPMNPCCADERFAKCDVTTTKHSKKNIWIVYGIFMMTSSNGNNFPVTGPLCGEFTGPGEFPAQRPVTRSLDVFFDQRLNKRLSKQSWGWWFETPPWSLWRLCNVCNNYGCPIACPYGCGMRSVSIWVRCYRGFLSDRQQFWQHLVTQL